MMKNNLRINNLYYQTNNTSQIKSGVKGGAPATHSSSSLGSNQDPYQRRGTLNYGSKPRKTKSKQGFAKSNYLSLDGSMAKTVVTQGQLMKAPEASTQAQQQVWNAKLQYENCCLNTQMLRGMDKSRSLSSCSQYNPQLSTTRLSSMRTSV